MVATVEPGTARPRFNPAALLLLSSAIVFAVFRMAESPASPATMFRLVMSALAIGFVVFARRKSAVQRAAVFIALEALGGIVAFAYVDIPFVMSHQVQIGRLAVSLYDDISRR